MEFVADAALFRRLWEVQLKPLGGLFPVALQANCSHSVLVVADHRHFFSLIVVAHRRLHFLCFFFVSEKKACTAAAALGMSSVRICLVFLRPSFSALFPFSFRSQRVMWVASMTRSCLIAHAPHSPRQKKM
jgi:hypothetical protein